MNYPTVSREKCYHIRVAASDRAVGHLHRWVPRLFHSIMRGILYASRCDEMMQFEHMLYRHIKILVRGQNNLGLYDNVSLPDIDTIYGHAVLEQLSILKKIYTQVGLNAAQCEFEYYQYQSGHHYIKVYKLYDVPTGL